jgi:hypothetical protein
MFCKVVDCEGVVRKGRLRRSENVNYMAGTAREDPLAEEIAGERRDQNALRRQ